MSDFKAGRFVVVLSELVEAEIQDAPVEVKEKYLEFLACAEDVLELSAEALALADEYLRHGILTANFRDDARHIAAATVAGADLLVSWNFKHIVKFDKIQKFNAVNMENAYKPIMIYSPREVTEYGSQGR